MSQQRRILHLIARLDGYGEAGQLSILVQQQLAAGWRVRVVALAADRAARAALEAAGASCRVLDCRWTIDPFAAGRLAHELRCCKADLIQVWGWEALNFAVAARPRSVATPWVATLAKAPAGKTWSARYFQWLGGQIDQVVVTSDTVCQSCQTIGITEEKILVIPPGVVLSRSVRSSRDLLLAELALPADARLIATAGSLMRSQRIDDAIWCFELARIFDARLRLLIFGDGPDRQRLERFVRLVSDPEAVRFLGYRAEMVDYLPHVDQFWQAGEEGSPIAVLEAMAAGLPVVATNLPVHREAIDDGRTGCLVPVGNRALRARATGRLLQDTKYAASLGAAANEEIARKFSAEQMARTYAQLHQRLLQGVVVPRP